MKVFEIDGKLTIVAPCFTFQWQTYNCCSLFYFSMANLQLLLLVLLFNGKLTIVAPCFTFQFPTSEANF